MGAAEVREDSGGGASGRPAEREGQRPGVREDPADTQAGRRGPVGCRGHQLRLPKVGAAASRRRGGAEGYKAGARRAVPGANT